MLKWNYTSVISYVVNIFFLSLFSYLFYKIISNSIVLHTPDVYLKSDLENRPFLGFVFLIFLINILHFLIIRLFCNHMKLSYKIFIRIIISIIFVWYFASLYRTLSIFILLNDPRIFVTYIPLLIAGVLLPFSEIFIIAFLSKLKANGSKSKN